MKEDLKNILSERRYIHSVGVMEMCEKLAKIYKVDVEKAKIAGLLHDNAKEMSPEEMLNYVKKNNIEITEIPINLYFSFDFFFSLLNCGPIISYSRNNKCISILKICINFVCCWFFAFLI